MRQQRVEGPGAIRMRGKQILPPEAETHAQQKDRQTCRRDQADEEPVTLEQRGEEPGPGVFPVRLRRASPRASCGKFSWNSCGGAYWQA